MAQDKKGESVLFCYFEVEYPLALNSSLGAPCVDFGNLGRFADFSPVSHPKFPKNSTTSTANTRIFDLDSVN